MNLGLQRIFLCLLFAFCTLSAQASPSATLTANGHAGIYETTANMPITLKASIHATPGDTTQYRWVATGTIGNAIYFCSGTNGWGLNFEPLSNMSGEEEGTFTLLDAGRLPVGSYKFWLTSLSATERTSNAILYVIVRNAAPSLKVGVLVDATGNLASLYQDFAASAMLATSSIESYMKTSIALDVNDTAGNPETALAKLKELKAKGIRSVVTIISSVELAAIQTYAAEEGIFLFNPISTTTSIGMNDTTTRNAVSSNAIMEATAEYAHAKGFTSIIPIVCNDLYGQDLLAQMQETMAKKDITVATAITFTASTLDTSAVLTAVTQALVNQPKSAVTAIHLTAFPDEALAILAAAADADASLKNVSWIGGDGVTKMEHIFKNEKALAFARAVNLVGPIPSPELAYDGIPVSPSSALAYVSMASMTGEAVSDWAYYVHDAFWLACIAEKQAEEQSITTTADFATLVASIAPATIGITGSQAIDENNDRKYGQIGIYGLDATENYWIPKARFMRLRKQGYYIPFSMVEFTKAEKAPATIEIGVMLPETGSAASMGTVASAVGTLAQKILKKSVARNPWISTNFEYVSRDTQSDPKVALQIIEEFNNRGIKIVVGPMTSSCVEAVQSYADAHDIVILTPTSTAMSLAKNDTTFRLGMNDNAQITALKAYLDYANITTLIPIVRNDTYGDSILSELTSQFVSTSEITRTLATPIRYETTTTDFTATVTAAEAALAAARTNTPTANIAFFYVGLDEATSLFEACFGAKKLAEVRWFGADGYANNNELLTNANALAFASDVQFTAFTMMANVDTQDFLGITLALGYVNRFILEQRSGYAIGGRELAVYDAFSTAVFAYLAKDCVIEDRATLLDAITISGKAMHSTYSMSFDPNGDRVSGDIGFYQVTQHSGASYWKAIAEWSRDFVYTDNFMVK